MAHQPIPITPRCPIRTTLELIGGKWKLLIIRHLADGTLRFSELRRLLPDISERILVYELKQLVDSELVSRVNHGEVPPRVDYALTEKGKRAIPLIEEMARFGLAYLERPEGRS